MRHNQKKARPGFNLVEAAIVLGVVGLIIGGIWAAAADVKRTMIANDTVTGLQFAKDAAQKTLSVSDAMALGHNTIMNDLATKVPFFPQNWIMLNASNTLYAALPSNNKSSFQFQNKVYSDFVGFAIWVYYLTPKDCTEIVLKMTNNPDAQKPGFAVGTNTDLIAPLTGAGLTGVLFYDSSIGTNPVPADVAAAKCLLRGTGAVNTVGFMYRYTRVN